MHRNKSNFAKFLVAITASYPSRLMTLLPKYASNWPGNYYLIYIDYSFFLGNCACTYLVFLVSECSTSAEILQF